MYLMSVTKKVIRKCDVDDRFIFKRPFARSALRKSKYSIAKKMGLEEAEFRELKSDVRESVGKIMSSVDQVKCPFGNLNLDSNSETNKMFPKRQFSQKVGSRCVPHFIEMKYLVRDDAYRNELILDEQKLVSNEISSAMDSLESRLSLTPYPLELLKACNSVLVAEK